MEEISRLFSIKVELPCKGQNRLLKIWKEILFINRIDINYNFCNWRSIYFRKELYSKYEIK